MNKPEISVIIPVYNEENNINELYNRIAKALKDINDYEIIFINDCSTDNTEERIKLLCNNAKEVKLISLSRNYGHQIALSCGYDFANGKAVISLDGDLQHPPEILPEMIKLWKDGGEIIIGRRANFDHLSVVKRMTSKVFYNLLNFIADFELIVDAADFRLVDEKVVHYLRLFREKSRFLRGVISVIGFKKLIIDYQEQDRFSGRTKYSFKKMLSFALKGILSFSTAPLRFSIYMGMLISLLSIIYALWIIYYKIAYGISPGLASIIAGIFFATGIQLFFLGVIGEYIALIIEEVKNRPLYCISKKIRIE